MQHSNSSKTTSALEQQPFNATTTTANADHHQQLTGRNNNFIPLIWKKHSWMTDTFNFTSSNDFHDDKFFVADTQMELMFDPSNSEPIGGHPEWDGANPDAVLAHLKALKETAYPPVGLKKFYKSCRSWSKLRADQQDKALAWSWMLLEHDKFFFWFSFWVFFHFTNLFFRLHYY